MSAHWLWPANLTPPGSSELRDVPALPPACLGGPKTTVTNSGPGLAALAGLSRAPSAAVLPGAAGRVTVFCVSPAAER